MKIAKLLLSIIMTLVCANTSAQEQKVWSGNLSTEKLEEFSIGKYTEVQGNITIRDYQKEDLNLLLTLQKCTENIIIRDNKKLESLKGLENLLVVGGKIVIKKNPELYRFCSLQKKLLDEGIKGEEISKGIIEKVDIERNGYNPSYMNLQNKDCYSYKIEDFCFSC